MRRFGLIGYPLGHSFSKKFFTEKFERENIVNCTYDNFPLESIGEFPDLINSVPELEGLNVTIPYKTTVIKHLDSVEKEASDIGAVNVIKLKRSAGRIVTLGFNSDITGIKDSIRHVVNDIKQAMVLGTGGSSRSVCYVLEQSGIKVIRVSRKSGNGAITYSEITPGMLEQTDLIVNTTPLGMFPDTHSKPDISYRHLEQRHILFDLVYNPEITAFLYEGQKRGCTIIKGIEMLWSQAERSWLIWNDDNY